MIILCVTYLLEKLLSKKNEKRHCFIIFKMSDSIGEKYKKLQFAEVFSMKRESSFMQLFQDKGA